MVSLKICQTLIQLRRLEEFYDVCHVDRTHNYRSDILVSMHGRKENPKFLNTAFKEEQNSVFKLSPSHVVF